MLSARATLPDTPSGHPPIVLVHGAANSAAVWTSWQRDLAGRGWPNYALDLRGHGDSASEDLSETSMYDYADDVVAFARQLRDPPILMGWSMGGLVAMMAAPQSSAAAVVGLAPSTPAETENEAKIPHAGEYGADYYGITSGDVDSPQPAMPDLDREERVIALGSLCKESAYARGERARGVVIESLQCPMLIATGMADPLWPRSRYDGMHLAAAHISVEGASHWGLVLSRRALAQTVPQVDRWLRTNAGASPRWH